MIYEKEIEQLKEEIEHLKKEAQEAVQAKKDFISRDLKLIRGLGSGGFGTVLLVEHTVSGQFFAAKRFTVRTDDQDNILREIKSLAPLNHPIIISYKYSFNVGKSILLYQIQEI